MNFNIKILMINRKSIVNSPDDRLRQFNRMPIPNLKTHHSAKYTEFTDASGARPKQPILTDVLQKKKTRTHREREVERKTVPHRLSDCLCT